MDGPRNYHAKWSQPYIETPTSNAIAYMWNLKKDTMGFAAEQILTHRLGNTYGFQMTGGGVGEGSGGLGWKYCKIWLWWLLYTYKCNKINKNAPVLKEKKRYKWTYLQNRNRLTDFEKLMVTKGDRWEVGRDGLGVWDWHMHTGMWNDWLTGTCCIAQRTVRNILW